MKRRMSSISAFYKYLRKKRIITENPMEFIDRPKNDTDIIVQTYLTLEQVELMRNKLKECINKNEREGKRLQLYALFSLSTMARVNAVANLRWDQIDFENRVCNNVLEKEGRYVTLYFSKEVKELLLAEKKYQDENNISNGGYVFYSNYNNKVEPVTNGTLNGWCKKIGEMIGVPTLHPHDFRHSAATLLKNNGMSLEDVSFLLNHLSTDVTKKFYIKNDDTKISRMKDEFEI